MPFDATQMLLCEQGLPAAQRSTTTLLLQLRAHVVTPPWERDPEDEAFWELCRELARRSLNAVGILKSSVADAVADSVLRQVTQPRGEGEHPDLTEWRRVHADHLGCHDSDSEPCRDEGFLDRTRGWFVRLCEEDIEAYLSWQSPLVPLFRDMPITTPDPVGLWIWTRFTEPDLMSWPLDCLLRERALHAGDTAGVDQRALRERTYDELEVTRAAMDRMQGLTRMQLAPTDLSAQHFVGQALIHLQNGAPQDAADIFAALSIVRPGDGDVRNNLGFCLIPILPVQALNVLRDAATFPQSDPALNKANQAMALHLAGRDTEALSTLDLAISDLDRLPAAAGRTWYVWAEPDRCREIQIREESNVSAHVAGFRAHLLTHGRT